jgi:glyoxylase-like metal-dependent hydrolase (beta-lactamase superfamily II)
MRELVPGVFLEDRYPGVILGAIAAEGEVVLIDTPLRLDDGREWLAALAPYGRPRYVVLLDHHPDRVLGARGLDLSIVAQAATREAVAAWPDVYKGGVAIGAEADRLRRVTGVTRAVPQLAFTETLTLMLGETPVELWHRPGPTSGACWVVFPSRKVIFVGDTVALKEPPYVGEADPEAWLQSLHELRGASFRKFRLVSSRDGVLKKESLANMASLLRKIDGRLERMVARGDAADATERLALQLGRSFRIASARKEQVAQRLQRGLEILYTRRYLAAE